MEPLEKIVGIYKITSPSGKIYIGQSSNIFVRWLHYSRLCCKYQVRLYNSIKKHGWQAHDREIIKLCDREDLDYWERFYIKGYDCFDTPHGLNLRDGGRKNSKLSLETIGRIKLSASKTDRKGEKNNFFGRVHSEETKKRWSDQRKGKKISEEHKRILIQCNSGPRNLTPEQRRVHGERTKKIWENKDFYHRMSVGRIGAGNPTSRKVYQFTMDGVFMREWPSIMDASRSQNKYVSIGISSCCSGRTKSCYGYIWQYSSAPIDLSKFKKKEREYDYKKVDQYSMEGVFIKTWGNMKEAANCLSLTAAHIGQCCLLKDRSAGGFVWRLHNDKTEIDLTPRYGHRRPILQYTKDGCLVKEWDSAKSAAMSLGRNDTSCIVRVCQEEKKSAYGYIWKYKNEDK